MGKDDVVNVAKLDPGPLLSIDGLNFDKLYSQGRGSMLTSRCTLFLGIRITKPKRGIARTMRRDKDRAG